MAIHSQILVKIRQAVWPSIRFTQTTKSSYIDMIIIWRLAEYRPNANLNSVMCLAHRSSFEDGVAIVSIADFDLIVAPHELFKFAHIQMHNRHACIIAYPVL